VAQRFIDNVNVRLLYPWPRGPGLPHSEIEVRFFLGSASTSPPKILQPRRTAALTVRFNAGRGPVHLTFKEGSEPVGSARTSGSRWGVARLSAVHGATLEGTSTSILDYTLDAPVSGKVGVGPNWKRVEPDTHREAGAAPAR
jgi:hypothetical protein